jgi:flagellar FliJ protein
MARFKFSLQVLLDARSRHERSVQRELAAADRHRRALERQLHDRQQEMIASRDMLRSALTGRLDPGMLRQKASSSLQAMRLVHQVARDLAAAHQRLSEVRARLVEAMRQRRAIELLRERRYAAWRAEQDRAEAAALDELAITMAARHRRIASHGEELQ